ncbi:MAG: amidohydrolase [Verrucomicrobia bacterium]|nr:amidohydrolase [Verrucomicrobiota bacterium]
MKALPYLVAAALALFSAHPASLAQSPKAAADAVRQQVRARAEAELPTLLELYKHLHANPELSIMEEKTAARISAELRKAGFTVTEKIGGHGVVGVLRNGPGKTVLVRTDLDALPVTETTGLPYASKVRTKDWDGNEVGTMHACGHDVHMTSFIGTARTLAAIKDRWAGTLVFIGQPAEEKVGGAKLMLADGLFTRFPRPDYCLALHVASDLPAGTVGFTEGFMLANSDSMDILVRGVGGHGAWPHTTKDPIVLAAQIILALQTVVSRETPAIEPAVVTVGSIHGGTKHNIIPEEVRLQLTLRSYSDTVRDNTIASIKRITRGLGLAAGLPEDKLPVVTVQEEGAKATYNDPALTQRVVRAFNAWIGEGSVLKRQPVMGAEDFGLYGRTEHKVPICMFWLGTISSEVVNASLRTGRSLPSLHSSLYAPQPEPSIRTGVTAMSAAVLELLGKP